ncbi:MAG: NAD-glutamate dehydrogenase domain-containing protein [Pseudomonadota bacterium]
MSTKQMQPLYHAPRIMSRDRWEEFSLKLHELTDVRFSEISENMAWLLQNMPSYFFITMSAKTDALINLAMHLHSVKINRKVTLVDREDELIIARLDRPGSLYDTLKTIRDREISYAEITHSIMPVPGATVDLEVQRFEFDISTEKESPPAEPVGIPRKIRQAVAKTLRERYPDFNFADFKKTFDLLWCNNPSYVQISPFERIARILWVYQQTRRNHGFFFDVETTDAGENPRESRVLFGVALPPRKEFLHQVMEVFQRLDIGVRRAYSLTLAMDESPYFLGNFYVRAHDGSQISKRSVLCQCMQTELYNTQILSTESWAYTNFLSNRIMTGEEASLAEAFIAFSHTMLSHFQPDRFDLETVKSAFYLHPDIVLMLINLFRIRFDPQIENRKEIYRNTLAEVEKTVREYNTGQRYLDEIRRTIFKTALLMISHTLKTNFFVLEKHALVFRLDPTYLAEMDPALLSDLPAATPFRITFFFGRHGAGYHIGFSDIARGGWRTIICRTPDEYITSFNNIFREVFVLAHTQHLKNKDIYEGGSKLTVLIDARDLKSSEAVTRRLYKLQFGFIHAFFDIFITENGTAKHDRVVDYYREDEPIELGPDENLHDEMVEMIARLAVERGYILGIGVISSKRIGINHKAYGVTSRGVVKAAEIALKELGIDIHKDTFTIKITGGPYGDVAGNSIRQLLEQCPKAKFLSIVDGSGGLFDPAGADSKELQGLVLKADADHFPAGALNPGGFILFRNERRLDGFRELYRKAIRTDAGVEEHWVTADEFHHEIAKLTFKVKADLFLPCGGRPETIDRTNWNLFFCENGELSARVIVEGANSFITPEARTELQKRGVVLLRDATANKCGVISSSYEIIANLLMNEKEFLKHKEAYVADVIEILKRRAEEEVTLIFKRYRENRENRLYTEITDDISREINGYYARLFHYFQEKKQMADEPIFRKVILKHMPSFIRNHSKYRARIKDLPPKIKIAILASELATTIVYHGGWEVDFENRLRAFVKGGFISGNTGRL